MIAIRQRAEITASALAVLLVTIAITGYAQRDTIAEIAAMRGHYGLALVLVDRDAPLAMRLGNYYFGFWTYNLAAAREAYAKAVSADPAIFWGHFDLARIDFVNGDLDTALKEVNDELEAQPANLRSLYLRGLIEGNQGNLAGAETDFTRFTAWAPSEWAGYNDLAWILGLEKKFAEMETEMRFAVGRAEGGETNPWLLNELGVAELNLGQYPQAEMSFEKAARYAAALTTSDWRNAYPGNDPAQDARELAAFRGAIDKNLRTAAVEKSL